MTQDQVPSQPTKQSVILDLAKAYKRAWDQREQARSSLNQAIAGMSPQDHNWLYRRKELERRDDLADEELERARQKLFEALE